MTLRGEGSLVALLLRRLESVNDLQLVKCHRPIRAHLTVLISLRFELIGSFANRRSGLCMKNRVLATAESI